MLGVIGGSGFYKLLEDAEIITIETPFGQPSSGIAIGKIENRDVAFLARHGLKHRYPPHKVPYKANIWALHELGVKQIISVTAVGSLRAEIKPGDFLIPNQFVNFTCSRDDTFYHGLNSPDEAVTHISSAEPFCPDLRSLLIRKCMASGLPLHRAGTAVVIQGPRFSTKAESEHFRSHGWDIVNMTLYPEIVLARELEMCYANISIITDYDAGLKDNPSVQPVTLEEVIKVFNANNEKIKRLILELIPLIPEERNCICSKALESARF